MIELGDEAKCKITGFKGVVTAMAKFLTGCDRVELRGPLRKDGKIGEGYWFDIFAVEVTKKGKVKPTSVQSEEKSKKGGPPTESVWR